LKSVFWLDVGELIFLFSITGNISVQIAKKIRVISSAYGPAATRNCLNGTIQEKLNAPKGRSKAQPDSISMQRKGPQRNSLRA
jgi:hypothetical protein